MAKKTNVEINGQKYSKKTRTIGHRADGTPIKKQFYASCERDAINKANEYINDLKYGLQPDKGIITVNILFPKWLFNYKKNELKPSTFERYEGLYRNYISPDLLSNRPIKEIKSIHLQKYYDRLQKTKTKHSTQNVSLDTIKSIHKLLRQFFAYAENEGYILKNPCANVKLPKEIKLHSSLILKNNCEIDYFSEGEIKVLIKLFDGCFYQDIIIFALATGMREGEILGLQWDDLDLYNKEIHVLHNLSNTADYDETGKKIGYSYKLLNPKTKKSIRTIPMNNTVYNLLINKERKSNTVFCSRAGNYIDCKNLFKRWQSILKASVLRYRKFHDLRHTFATMMLALGCDLITLKELMGHESIKTTETYLQALPLSKDKNINKMDLLLS